MPRSGSRFPLSRGSVIVCSSLQIVLAILDAITRLNHPQFSPLHWFFPSLMFSVGFVGLMVQSPRSNPSLRPLLVVMTIFMFMLTCCGVLAGLRLLPLDNLQVSYLLLLFFILSIVPGWINLIARLHAAFGLGWAALLSGRKAFSF